MNEQSIIKLFNLKYRHEDFGYLITNGYRYAVVDEEGIDVIQFLNKKDSNTYFTFNQLMTEYLSQFYFDTNAERDEAYHAMIQFFSVLEETQMINVFHHNKYNECKIIFNVNVPPISNKTIVKAKEIAEELQFKDFIFVNFYQNRMLLEKGIGREVEDWVKGATIGRHVHILSYHRNNYLNKQEFETIFLHEIVHSIINFLTNGFLPDWLNEGLAMILSNDSIPQKETEDKKDYYEMCYLKTKELLKKSDVRTLLSEYVKEKQYEYDL